MIHHASHRSISLPAAHRRDTPQNAVRLPALVARDGRREPLSSVPIAPAGHPDSGRSGRPPIDSARAESAAQTGAGLSVVPRTTGLDRRPVDFATRVDRPRGTGASRRLLDDRDGWRSYRFVDSHPIELGMILGPLVAVLAFAAVLALGGMDPWVERVILLAEGF